MLTEEILPPDEINELLANYATTNIENDDDYFQVASFIDDIIVQDLDLLQWVQLHSIQMKIDEYEEKLCAK